MFILRRTAWLDETTASSRSSPYSAHISGREASDPAIFTSGTQLGPDLPDAVEGRRAGNFLELPVTDFPSVFGFADEQVGVLDRPMVARSVHRDGRLVDYVL